MIRTIKLAISVLSVLLLLALAAACATAPTPAPTEVPPTPTALQMPTAEPATAAPTTSASAAPTSNAAGGEVTGASLYQLSCAACHASNAAGESFTKDGQTIKVPTLAWATLNPMFQTQPNRGTVPQQLTLAITKGQDETGGDFVPMMPRWSSLSQAQVDSLIQYLQTASTTTAEAPTLTPDATNLMAGPLYQAACAACHASNGAGESFTKDGQTIKVPTLAWATLNPMFQTQPNRGTVAQQLTLAITKGQDETGGDFVPMMPRWSSLSQAQVDSLIQYLQTTFP